MTNELNLPLAVLFDMDGVLVDSEPFIAEAGCRMLKEKGLDVKPEEFQPFIGTGEDRFLGGVAEKHGLKLNMPADKIRTYDIYLEIIKGRLEPLPGVHEFIDKCIKAGKKMALASSADHRKIEGNLAEIGINKSTFGAIIGGEDIEKKKPAPDIFLTAAEKLGVDPKHCLVIEDAVSGVKAAKAAGAKCLAITSTFSPEQLNGADFFAPDLKNAQKDTLQWL
jgi:HAD superfamily hydrolase (TIGR01509 family)